MPFLKVKLPVVFLLASCFDAESYKQVELCYSECVYRCYLTGVPVNGQVRAAV